MYKLIAHRGEKKSSKENSLAAFFDAIKGNYVGFECDLRMSKDKEFVIVHDPIYHGKLVKSTTYDELKKEGIVTLNEVLNIETDKIIMIDIKDPFIETDKLTKILDKYSNKKIYVMSFYDNVIRKLSDIKHTYKTGILNYVLNTDEKHFNYDFLCVLDTFCNNMLISDYKNKGKELFVYGVKKEELKDLYPYYIVD